MSSQTLERKAYRKWYHQNEPQSVKDARKAWKRSPKGKRCARNVQLKAMYGITLAEYEAILALQNGVCAICAKPGSNLKKGLHLDHNHVTGKNRGLLCGSCNTRLVSALEDPLLEKAQAYLVRWD